ncbi:MAG: hypothetical protein IT371_26970 [Deltaproteobacteria bacterium]|nr:hypothetical protein [Deltaproteobacteria bacterium]
MVEPIPEPGLPLTTLARVTITPEGTGSRELAWTAGSPRSGATARLVWQGLAPTREGAVVAEAFDARGTLVGRGQAQGVALEDGARTVVAIRLRRVEQPGDAGVAALRLGPGRFISGEALPVAVELLGPASSGALLWSSSAGTIEEPRAPITTLRVPLEEGTVALTASLLVPQGAIPPLSATFAVRPTGSADVTTTFNTWPAITSLAPSPALVAPGASTSLVLSANDSDGDPMTYAWSDGGGACAGTFSDASAASPSWTAPATVPPSGSCTLSVAITDGRGGSTSGAVTLTVGTRAGNVAPAIGPTFQATERLAPGESATFRVAATDPEGGPLTFAWSASAGSLGTPTTTAGESEVRFTAPAAACGQRLRALVTDDAGATTEQLFSVTCPTCGNGALDAGEVCDGSALGGRTCAIEGFTAGTLACTTSCTLDRTGCRKVTALASGTTATLRAVGGSPARTWAVGASGAAVALTPGGGAQLRPAPVTSTLRAVWAASANDAFFVGEGGTALRFDGLRFAPQSVGTAVGLYGCWGGSASNGWLVGAAGTARRFDGASWQAVTSGVTQDLFAVAGLGASEILAVGASGVARRGGASGLVAVTTGTTRNLFGLWLAGPTDGWAVGANGTLLRFDGTRFVATPSGTGRPLYGVWGSGPSEVWAVGAMGTLLRFDGASWKSVASGTTKDLYGVWGAGPSEAWAVGASGTVLRLEAGQAD